MITETKIRKIRSDKKRDIKPTLPFTLKESVYRLSYITNTPVKDVADYLIISGIESKRIMDQLSQYFRRGLIMGNTVFMGDLSRTSIQKERRGGKKERITVRVTSDVYEKINLLAFSMDCTPSTAVAILIEKSLTDVQNINKYAKRYFQKELEPIKMKQLKELLKYIEHNNPYEEKFNWMEMLNYFIEEAGVNITEFGRGVSKWIKKNAK